MDKKQFKQLLGRPFAENGFLCKGQTWFLNSDEVLALANLQKDEYAPSYFLNLAFWIKALGEPPSEPPGEHVCHVRIRAESLFPEIRTDILNLLDPTSVFSHEERTDLADRVLRDNVIPTLLSSTSLAGLLAILAKPPGFRGFVHVQARQLLVESRGKPGKS